MTDTKIADLVGLSEIAEMYGVDTNTANGWRRRKDFPKPVHQLRMGPMWDRAELLAWRKPVPDYPIRQTIPCFHCGGPTSYYDNCVDQGTKVQIQLNCYADCPPTILHLTHVNGPDKFEAAIITQPKEA